MSAELLEIQPRELKFIFELKKQSSSSVRLVNKSNNHVAFKVKTTSPKKYCVRPNTGIIKPKSTYDFTVTMQAQKLVPPDMICKDKFLVQSTVVPAGTTDDDITPGMVTEDVEFKMEYSEELEPAKDMEYKKTKDVEEPAKDVEYKTMKHVEEQANDVENKTVKDVKEPAKEVVYKTVKDVEEPKKEVEYKTVKDMEEPAKDVDYKTVKDVEEPAKEVEYKTMKDVKELKLVKDVEDMKSKLNELESKLSEAEVTISKLTEERRWIAQEGESFQQELALLRSNKRGARKVQVGFPFLFVCMVSLISVMLGYLLNG